MITLITNHLEEILEWCGISMNTYNRLPSLHQARIFSYIYQSALEKQEIDGREVHNLLLF